MSVCKVSVVKSTDTTDTKLWYSYVSREWGVSVRSRSFDSVGRVRRGSQGKGGLVADTSQKASQIPFFSTKKPKKSQLPAFQSPSVLHQIIIIQHPWELIPFKWRGTLLRLRWYKCTYVWKLSSIEDMSSIEDSIPLDMRVERSCGWISIGNC